MVHMKSTIQDLRVAVIQADYHWEDPVANRNLFFKKVNAIEEVDLIVFPEMFTTGFSLNVEEMAEMMDGPSVEWMLKLSGKKDAAVCGSLIIKEKSRYYNRFVWAQPDGKILWYDKRHLFRMGEENEIFTPGNNRLIIEWRGWRICPLICYDLRFPVFSRNRNDYDLLLYVANWPASRRNVWQTLLPARAIENQAYCIGVNRLGTDGAGLPYSGDSMIIDPIGTVMADGEDRDSILVKSLSLEALSAFRKSFPVYLDGDRFSIDI